jgi:hypothetical protein
MPRSGGNTAVAQRMADSMAMGGVGFSDREQQIMVNPLMAQLPQYNLYLFSLYPEVLEKRCGSAGVYRIPACGSSEQVSKPCIIPSVVRSIYVDALDGMTKSDDVQGEAFAEDLMRPYMAGTASSIWSFGQNWEDFGAFWSKNQVPTEEEIGKAREKLEKTYRAALAEATQMEAQGKTDFTPVMRHAANYFEEDRPWNRTFKKKAECPGCGERVRAGIIMHPACGYIFDREAYDKNFAKKPKTI